MCAAAVEILGRFHDSWICHSHHKVKVGMGNIEPMQNIIKDIPCPTKHESEWDCHMYPYVVNDSSTSFFNGRNHHRSHRFPSF